VLNAFNRCILSRPFRDPRSQLRSFPSKSPLQPARPPIALRVCLRSYLLCFVGICHPSGSHRDLPLFPTSNTTSLAGVVTPFRLFRSLTSPLSYTPPLGRTSSLTQRSHRIYNIPHFGCRSGPGCGPFHMETPACQRLRGIRPVWLSETQTGYICFLSNNHRVRM